MMNQRMNPPHRNRLRRQARNGQTPTLKPSITQAHSMRARPSSRDETLLPQERGARVRGSTWISRRGPTSSNTVRPARNRAGFDQAGDSFTSGRGRISLLARFRRPAAAHVVEHVEERLAAPREPGFRGRFAGRELRRGMERDIALDFLRQLGGTDSGVLGQATLGW